MCSALFRTPCLVGNEIRVSGWLYLCFFVLRDLAQVATWHWFVDGRGLRETISVAVGKDIGRCISWINKEAGNCTPGPRERHCGGDLLVWRLVTRVLVNFSDTTAERNVAQTMSSKAFHQFPPALEGFLYELHFLLVRNFWVFWCVIYPGLRNSVVILGLGKGSFYCKTQGFTKLSPVTMWWSGGHRSREKEKHVLTFEVHRSRFPEMGNF